MDVSLIKELRERTGIGIMDCKRSLIEANGDINLAIENMRRSGFIKAAKKSTNITTDGVILTKVRDNYSIILEVNCQTDFVAKDVSFLTFVNRVLDKAFTEKITSVEILKAQFEEERVELVSKIGENINIRRVNSLEGSLLGSYQHGTRIGVLVSAKGSAKSVNDELVKQIAMHIAASKPEFVKSENIPTEVIKEEYRVQMEIAVQSSKSKQTIDQIVEGRMKKFISEISLTSQMFVIDPKKTVNQLLEEHNAEVIDFIRFELGENIDKIKANFPTEVSVVDMR